MFSFQEQCYQFKNNINSSTMLLDSFLFVVFFNLAKGIRLFQSSH